MVCCWLQYLYQRKRLEDERKKLLEKKNKSPAVTEHAKQGSEAPLAQSGSHTDLQLKPTVGSNEVKLTSNRGIGLHNFNSSSRNLNVAVEVKVSNHYHISKVPSTKKIVMKNTANQFKPRRSGYGIMEISPSNVTEKANQSKVANDKLSAVSGVLEKDLPTPTHRKDSFKEEQGFNIVDLGKISPPRMGHHTEPMIRARSTSNNHFQKYQPKHTDSGVGLMGETKLGNLDTPVSVKVTIPKVAQKILSPNLNRGRSSTILVKPSTQKDIEAIQEEPTHPVPPKKQQTEQKVEKSEFQFGHTVNKRPLPKIMVNDGSSQPLDSGSKSAVKNVSGGSGGKFSTLRDVVTVEVDSPRKTTALESTSRVMIKQFSSEEKFEVTFSRQRLTPMKQISQQGGGGLGFDSTSPRSFADLNPLQPNQSRRQSVRSPLNLKTPKS